MKTLKQRIKVTLAFLLLFLSCMSIHAQYYTIYPAPQKFITGEQQISLTSQVNVVAEAGVDETILQRAQEVFEAAGYTFFRGTAPVDDATNLLIGIQGSGLVADAYADANHVSKGVFEPGGNKFDAHLLQLNANHACGDILVLGDAEGSAYYAFATLEQLFEQVADKTFNNFTIEDYAFVKVRGIVEGFYGHVYSLDNRLDLLDYCKRYKMNLYFYGPKSDPYHAGKWRDPYPETVTEHERFMGQIPQDDIRQLAAKAKACHVDFVWSIHPALAGGGINFSDMDPGVDEIMEKFNHLHQLGVRHFGVSIDDMNGHPTNQKDLAVKVHRKLQATYNAPDVPAENHVGPMYFVPSQYCIMMGTHVLRTFSDIDKEIEIVFTGNNVFSHIDAYNCNLVRDLIGRNAVFWWNNPVNDDHDDYLYMHGLTARWNIQDRYPISTMGGLMMNPMNQAQASKVCLFGAADYSWNPEAYFKHERKSWEASLRSIVHDDTLYEALFEFIRMMSSYSQTQEGEEYDQLYKDFQNNFRPDLIPDASELLAAMDKGYEACATLQSLRTSDDPAHRLFYADIAPWLNKVQSMADIVRHSIRLMDKTPELSDWTVFANVQRQATMLHKDSLYFLSVLEGSGTGTYETYREALPTTGGLDNFVSFLSEQISNFTPKLPARNRDFEVITNKEETPVTIDQSEGLALQGLGQLEFQRGDFVGINFNAIKKATVSALPQEVGNQLCIEWSVNGKDWTPFLPDGETAIEMAYFRMKNLLPSSYTCPIDRIDITLPGIEYSNPISVRSNMPPYQHYVVDRVIDGNLESKFWSGTQQTVGQFVEVDYGTTVSRHAIEVYFEKNDRPTGVASVQLSKDAITWETISRVRASDIPEDGLFLCNANGKTGRYVRLYIEEVSGDKWFQLREIKVKGSDLITVASDNLGNSIDLFDDSSLASGYKAMDAGYVVYKFVENLQIDTVLIYHNSMFVSGDALPVVSIQQDDKWSVVGELNAPCTEILIKEFSHPSALKIEWGETNIPILYEIYPVGKPYVGRESTGELDILKSEAWYVSQIGFEVNIKAPEVIDAVRIFHVGGIVGLMQGINKDFCCLTLPSRGFWLVEILTSSGFSKTYKFLVK